MFTRQRFNLGLLIGALVLAAACTIDTGEGMDLGEDNLLTAVEPGPDEITGEHKSGPPHILTRTIFGEFITGLNRDDTLGTGTPRYRWGQGPTPFMDSWSFATMGVCDLDENGELVPNVRGKFIDSDTPDDAELCSIADPTLDDVLAAVGYDDSTLDFSRYGNRPIAQMETWRTPYAFFPHPSGVTNLEFPLPFPSDVTTPPTGSVLDFQKNSYPEIRSWTLGDWRRARARLKVKCNLHTGRAKFELIVKHAIPNSLFTFWAIWQFPDTVGVVDGQTVPVPVVFPEPAGGSPNTFVTDGDGYARMWRELNWCPLLDDYGLQTVNLPGLPQGQTSRAQPLVFLFHFHSDHIAYGGIPTPFAAGIPPGFRIHSLLEFTLKDDERLIPPSFQALTRDGFQGSRSNDTFFGPFWNLQ